jgi:alanyl-tRNA synthetase
MAVQAATAHPAAAIPTRATQNRLRRLGPRAVILGKDMSPPATARLYYDDATLLDFHATVTGLRDGGRIVLLDRTAFYPTSGGQPFDRGELHGIPVVDVEDEEAVIAHHLASPLERPVGSAVHGRVDAARRMDHMQQHTGQHLLSAWLADRYGWPTVSVHFGDESATVDVTADVAAEDLPEQLARIEHEVNEAVVANHPITISYEDAATVSGLRKASDRDGMLRIITIEGIDRSACGGTHVSRTGAIGAILLRRAERTRGQLRLEFLCGQRAVTRARLDADLLARTARPLSASPADLPVLIEQQQQRVMTLERDRRQLLETIAGYRATELWAATRVTGSGVRHVEQVVDGAVRDHETLAQALTARGPCTVLLTTASGGLLLAASTDSGVDAGKQLKAILSAHGGRGGGSPRMAQGTLPPEHLESACRALRDSLQQPSP